MPSATSQVSEDSRVKHCPVCEGRKYTERPPSDEEILNGSYYPSDIISSDCEKCGAMGEVEECAKCLDVFDISVQETYLNEYGMCFNCASLWRPRSAVVWELDEGGMVMFYYREVVPDQWASVGMQHSFSDSIYLASSTQRDLRVTDKLTWCADGGVIIDTNGTFKGIET